MRNLSNLCLLFRWLADVIKQAAAALQPKHQNHKNRIEPKEPGTAGLKNEKRFAFSCQNKVSKFVSVVPYVRVKRNGR